MKTKKQPIILYVLQGICILIALNRFMVTAHIFIRMESFSLSAVIPALMAVLWISASIGLVMKRRWGWGLFLGNIIFIFFTIINTLLFIKGNLSFGLMLPLGFGLTSIILLTRKSILTIYKPGATGHTDIPPAVITFAVICLFTGLYLTTEPFMLNQLTTSSLMSKLYITAIGIILILLGTGLWFGKSVAIHSMQPLLLFIALSASFILIRDFWIEDRRFAPPQIVFYVSLSVGYLCFWVWFLKSRLLQYPETLQ